MSNLRSHVLKNNKTKNQIPKAPSEEKESVDQADEAKKAAYKKKIDEEKHVRTILEYVANAVWKYG